MAFFIPIILGSTRRDRQSIKDVPEPLSLLATVVRYDPARIAGDPLLKPEVTSVGRYQHRVRVDVPRVD